MKPQKLVSDFLVIGSGIAGLSFAIKASKLGTVNLVTKKMNFDSNTNYAQGGIASVIASGDSFNSHKIDTIKAGAGLCGEEAVELLVKNGPDRIAELIQWGTNFSKSGTALDLGLEGGHSFNRIVHAKDLTGQEIERALLHTISNIKNITIYENHTAVDLLTGHQLKTRTDGDIHCYGAYILDNISGIVHTFNARTTMLATGGLGQVYLHTTNPDVATGDGIAMAYRAGAFMANMEFIQFHPTSLYTEKNVSPSFLISEAVRGAGGILLNSKGERFMEHQHELKELAPRDIVARAIDRELKRLGDDNVYLDISHRSRSYLRKRFPAIYNHCRGEGIRISKEPIPVVPAAHYLCGGIVSDFAGRTTIANLYVSGESAHTGVHGANRLASNSLLEGVVFSDLAYKHIATNYKQIKKIKIPNYPIWDKAGTFDLEESILVQHNIQDVKRIMWNYVGIVRTNLRVQRAYNRIIMLAEEIHNYYLKSTVTPQIIELRNLATVAKLIIKSANRRKDSVGLHFNSDHPQTSKKAKYVILKSEQNPKLVTLQQMAKLFTK